MKRPHAEMAAEHGWQRFTWFSYRRVHLEERCIWNTVTGLLFDFCVLIYLYVPGGKNSRHPMSLCTSSIMSEFIPKYRKGFVLLPEIKCLTLDIQTSERILKNVPIWVVECISYMFIGALNGETEVQNWVKPKQNREKKW